MKQSKYLFLGGPLDQQWREVPPQVGKIVTALEAGDGPTTSRMVNYHHNWMLVPGWFVPIAVFTTNPLNTPQPGTPMPGWVEGAIPEESPIPPLNWTGPTRHANRLHAAIKRRGFRP